MLGTHHISHRFDDIVSLEFIVPTYRRLNGVLCHESDQYYPNSSHAGESQESHLLWWTTRMEMRLENLLCKFLEIHTERLLDLRDWSQALNVSALFGLWVSMCFRAQTVDQ